MLNVICRLHVVASGLRNEKQHQWLIATGQSRRSRCIGPQPMTSTPIANEIRRWRFERGEMTQEALAQACGVTRQTIIALEAGKYSPSLELAFRIARAFGVGIDEVFRWKTE